MKKLRIETLKLLFSLVLIFATITTSIYGWFSSKSNTISTKVTGSIVFEYFHCGDGSKENPFVITRPIHYYHMVEFFQRVTILSIGNNEKAYFGKDYLYFQIGCPLAQLGDPSNTNGPTSDSDWYVFDYSNTGGVNERTNAQGEKVVPGTNALASKTLNMAYYSGERALMPTGSSEVPFLGSIDGHKMTIDNLHIVSTSTVNVVEENGTIHSNVQRHTADMGVFGCIARGIDLNENNTVSNVVENDVVTLREQSSIKNLYITNAIIDLDGTATSTEIVGDLPALPNGDPLHSNDYHLVNEAGEVVEENGTEVAYVGYIAGHVESGVEISSVYVNKSKILGGTKAMNGYGYFGLIIDSETGETISSLDNAIETVEQGSGQPNWGGSIDMLSLNKRIKYFLNNINKTGLNAGTYNKATAITYNKSIYTKSSSNVFRYYVDDYQSYSTYSGSSYNNDPASNQIIYRFVGGANNARATTSNPTSTSGTYFYDIPASYVPLLTKSEAEGYAVQEGNTGYFAGDLMHGSNTLRTASYANTYIGNSYANGELEVLSNSTVSYNANNYKKIDNGHTNNLLSNYSADISTTQYPGYAKAYQEICNVLSLSTFVQGLHFTGSTISSSSTTTIPKAYINGELITNYKTLRSSVDFNAKENGSIKFFAGSYYNTVGTNADSFFSLHVVTRTGNTITTNQIYYIYANTNEATKKDYPHLYYDENNSLIAAGYGNNVTKGDLEFDMRWLHNAPPVANAVYYFEIPVNAGEYALGSVASDKTKGAYLMYLDIGTNGAGEEETEVVVGGEGNDPIPYFNVDFRNPSDEASLLSDHAILQFSIKCPEETVLENSTFDDRKFSIYVEYDKDDKGTNNIYPKGTYSIYITNKIPSTSIYLTVYLSDDDYDSGTDFGYAYKIIYTNLSVTNHVVGTYQKVDVYVIPSSE